MTNEKETPAINSWQSLFCIIEALGEYEDALANDSEKICAGQHSNVIKSIGNALSKVASFCYFEEISFDEIVIKSRNSVVNKSLLNLTGLLAGVYLTKLNCYDETNRQKSISDICIVLTHIVGILELQARTLGSGIEIVESTGSVGVVTWSEPGSGNVQIKVFVKSRSMDSRENDARIVMCRRIEELMGESEEWCEMEDLHDCVMRVLDDRKEWKERAKKLAYDLDALKAISQRFGFIKIS